MSDHETAVVDIFDRHAKSYQGPALSAIRRGQASGRDLLLEWLHLQPGERVLELGCGSGILTLPIARAVGDGGRVVAFDLAPNMLALLQQVAPPNVEVRCMDIGDLGAFRSGEFDAVAAGFALQFCPDLDPVLEGIHRVLREDGRLAATVPVGFAGRLNSPIFAEIRALVPTPEHDIAAPLVQTRMRLSDEPALREALAAAGYRDVRLVRRDSPQRYTNAEELLAAMDGWWDWAYRVERLSEDEQRRVREAVLVELRRQFGDGPLNVPATTHVLYARG